MKRPMWILGIAAAAFVVGGALLARQAPEAPDTAAPSSTEQALGKSAAEELRKITDDPVAPALAPEGYDVTIVSYADYQCPFCRKLHAVLERLAQEDSRVRIVYRDWPIFGAASEEAAKAAIASQWQGKHAEFNDALMRMEGKLDSAAIRAAAEEAGIDWARLQADLDTRAADVSGVIDRTTRQAAEMRLQGTPALLVGPYLIPGAIDYSALTRAVQLAREFEHGR